MAWHGSRALYLKHHGCPEEFNRSLSSGEHSVTARQLDSRIRFLPRCIECRAV